MKKLGIVGCGWLGCRIAEKLSAQFEVYTTTSTPAKMEQLASKGFHPKLVRFSDDKIEQELKPWEVLPALDAVIITVTLSNKYASSKRWANLLSFLDDYKGQLFYMSSTSAYPEAEQEFFEADVAAEVVSGEKEIKEKYPQVNILRLAGLMGDERLLSKYKVANLNHAVNHIHYADICTVLEKMMELQLNSKLYNVVAPLHPSKAEVINQQKQIDYSEQEEVRGKRISSAKLISELDFVFSYPDPRDFHL